MVGWKDIPEDVRNIILSYRSRPSGYLMDQYLNRWLNRHESNERIKRRFKKEMFRDLFYGDWRTVRGHREVPTVATDQFWNSIRSIRRFHDRRDRYNEERRRVRTYARRVVRRSGV